MRDATTLSSRRSSRPTTSAASSAARSRRRSCAPSGRRSASLALERGRDTLVIGRDGRLSGPELAAALADGIRAAGADVIDVGMVATPMTLLRRASSRHACSVMVTGSHNPPDYNGLKMVVAGDTLSGDDIQALRTRIESGAARVRRRHLSHARHRAPPISTASSAT